MLVCEVVCEVVYVGVFDYDGLGVDIRFIFVLVG